MNQQRLIRKKVYDVDEILKQTLFIPKTSKFIKGQRVECGKERKVLIDGELINMASDRYKLFFDNRKCVSCGLEGTMMIMERGNKDISYHFNMYGFDEDNNEILFTKDHIIPLSKGGTNHFSNLQTMCVVCNSKKKDICPNK